MPIQPPSVKLTNLQTQQFTLLDAGGNPVPMPIAWALSAATGTGAPAPNGEYTYTAPGTIAGVTDLVLSATVGGVTETAAIQLVPPEVILTPVKVTLGAGEFVTLNATVPGDPNNAVVWTFAPGLGEMAGAQYTAPAQLNNDRQVTITATSTVDPHKSATANVTLLSQPPLWYWAPGIFLYLVAIFCLVFLLIDLWPPASNPNAPSNVTAAQTALDQANPAANNATTAQQNAQAAVKTAPQDATKTKALEDATQALKQATDARQKAELDLQNAKKQLAEQNCAPGLFGPVSRDVNLIWLVLITGALGSFVYGARSFVGFAGNRTLRISWSAWYLLYPLIGAALALIFYLVVRGGFLTAATLGSEVNLYGLVAISGLVGMFSKQATTKLDELFSTLFKTDKDDKSLKDKMAGP